MSKLKLKYGIGKVSAVAAFVGVAGLSLPQALAGDVLGIQVSDLGTQRAKIEYELQKQECDTLKNSQPQGYESCLQKAQSTRDNLLKQAGSAPAGQGSQGFGSNQSQQQSSGQEKGPIDKMTSAVKEKLADWGIGSSNQGREGQPNAGQGQQGQGFAQGQTSQQGLGTGGQQPQGQSTGQQQGGGLQAPNRLQQGFEARHTQGEQGQQGQSGQSQGSFQGGNYGQQPQGQSGQQGSQGGNYGQQPQGQSGQQGSQGGNYGQQPQGQSGQQGAGGTNQQSQSGGTQGFQGSSNHQRASTGGWVGEKQGAHMDPGEYYQVLARQQYVTLKQECNTLMQDPNVYEQCQKHAESIREKILGMAEQGDQRGG